MVSRISEDSVINMGRKLEYEAFDRESGEILDYKNIYDFRFNCTYLR